MKTTPLVIALLLTLPSLASAQGALPFQQWAPAPPMGWNSWDSFATTITEKQARTEADYMAEHLAPHGYTYFVIDHRWYDPVAAGFNYGKDSVFVMDKYGRFTPDPKRFPSAADGTGFKALADYVHSKGLKFGLHLMRGIPRQAVAENTAILGTPYHADDIADRSSTCRWNTDMYGVDMSKPGAQAYYDSVFKQFAAWGLDFIKVDDLSRPYHAPEIEAIRQAIDKTGRVIVFSTSPGETPVKDAGHVIAHANMWRISDDFWDNWKLILHQADLDEKWAPYLGKGGWPDSDMLPLGMLRMGKSPTRLTPAEQRTLMTLWSIVRSPLILGGDMPTLDPATLALLTNDAVLAVDQHSSGNRLLFHHPKALAWVADVPGASDKYLAIVNLQDKTGDTPGAAVSVTLADLGITGSAQVRDLWEGTTTTASGTFSPTLPWHGAGLYRIGAAVK